MRTLVLAECPGETEMPVPEMEQIRALHCVHWVGGAFRHPGRVSSEQLTDEPGAWGWAEGLSQRSV